MIDKKWFLVAFSLIVYLNASNQEVVFEYDDLDYHVAPVMKFTKDGKSRLVPVSSSANDCFCKLTGDVDDCNCKIDYIDKFNNYQVHPRLRALVQHSYFRYIKINLKKICQFWPDDARCSLKDCHVTTCSEEDLPDHFKKYFTTDTETENCEQSNPLGQLNNTLTDDDLRNFEEWNKYDASQDNFCEPDDKDEFSKNAEYMDLVANPERYTGYKAPHAHKIWRSIYQENCFDNPNLPTTMSPYYATSPEHQTCLEKRVFHRLISGLHASINIHLSAEYLHKGVLNQPDHWGPNVEEFKRRFDPETTNGMGPQWLKNLYFIYLVELRAIHKAAPYLSKEAFFATGDPQLDQDVKAAVIDLLNVTSTFKSHFDESVLFRGDPIEARQLKDQFQYKFRNITKIMDCVGCDKCKLWGKVQTLALGTALKILFSGKTVGPESRVDKDLKNTFQLSRSEIVALFNGFARLSNSISQVELFREILNKDSGSSSFLKPPSTPSRHPQSEL